MAKRQTQVDSSTFSQFLKISRPVLLENFLFVSIVSLQINKQLGKYKNLRFRME